MFIMCRLKDIPAVRSATLTGGPENSYPLWTLSPAQPSSLVTPRRWWFWLYSGGRACT